MCPHKLASFLCWAIHCLKVNFLHSGQKGLWYQTSSWQRYIDLFAFLTTHMEYCRAALLLALLPVSESSLFLSRPARTLLFKHSKYIITGWLLKWKTWIEKGKKSLWCVNVAQIKKCARRESNPQPLTYPANALPAELLGLFYILSSDFTKNLGFFPLRS